MLRRSSVRSGISLTEILISIMIMAIGMVSLATLFPIGLMRMRDATRDARSTILAVSAANDAAVRGLPRAKGLVNPDSFIDLRLPWYAEWRGLNVQFPNYPFTITPFTHDIATPRTGNARYTDAVFAGYFAPGLPVAYDPLFWATTHYSTEGLTPLHTPLALSGTQGSEGRFGSGIGFIRNAGSDPPPAHGLQRITNFAPYSATIPWPYTYALPSTTANPEFTDIVGKIFTSIDDPVLTDDETGQSGSPVVPADFNQGVDALGNPIYQSERSYEFTWMLTGRLGVAGDPSVFQGDLVIFHRRPIGLDPTPGAFDPSTSYLVPTGERVVEAIWGYTNTDTAIRPIPAPQAAGITGGYSVADDRTVLLRWPRSMPDPLIRVGDYIADVTYERYQSGVNAHYPPDQPSATGPQNGVEYSGQRIFWYRIVQRGEVEVDPSAALPTAHNRVIVRVDTPLQAKTRLVVNSNVVESAVPEAALINPYVVRVAPIILNSR